MKNTLEYKGYNGSVEYSPNDKCLYGKIPVSYTHLKVGGNIGPYSSIGYKPPVPQALRD